MKIKLDSRLVGDERWRLDSEHFLLYFELTASEIVYYDRLNCCEDIDLMFPGEMFSKERSLLLFLRKLPDSYASCNGENFIISKRVAFRLLALAAPDPVKMEIKISYPERDIMECTLVVIVFSVNAGKVINTRREVVEAVSLMLFKSLILCVHLEASWN